MSYLPSMLCKTIALHFILLLIFLPSKIHCSNSEAWIKSGYWYAGSELPVSDINSALFTHLICSFVFINSSTYHLSINPSYQRSFSTFTNLVKHQNPSVLTLLSIRTRRNHSSLPFSSMLNQFSYRNSFIQSSIQTVRLYGFHGLDLCCIFPNMGINMTDLGTLLEEWRDAVVSESRNSGKSELLLVMGVPAHDSVSYPLDSIGKNLDWVRVVAYDYYVPTRDNFTGAHAALYGDHHQSWFNTNHGINEWLSRGLSGNQLVLGLPYHGYAWTLVNPDDNSIGAPAIGPAITIDGSMGYKFIKSHIKKYGYGSVSWYNSSYVVNFWHLGKNWINFDDVEAIRAKIAYAREKRLRGYSVFQLSNDDNWELSRAAQGEDEDGMNKRRLLVIILVAVALVILILSTMMCYFQRRVLMSKGIMDTVKKLLSKLKGNIAAAENFNSNAPNLQVFSFTDIKVATNNFSSENKLGEGGFGPVYKGKFPMGQKIAVKRLSKTSHQGLEEFENEVTLTARLQHVNLLRVLGFCTLREEKILIYEYMPNKSLDFYLFDILRRYLLDWRKRIHIIEGITQGLLYLQEYSNFTIIHRDLKASNILLDNDMNPKISDFGLAKLFKKDEGEANTGRLVGTYGYVPPEYVKKGIYSVKYDVYSFGVLLLQIISGKRTSCYYGSNENLNLLDYAHELWKDGEGMEFFDGSLDDSSSSCKLLRCMQVALLCVQENPVDRPSMLKVSSMLKNGYVTLPTPKKPAFSIKRDEDEETKCKLRETICSINDVTTSQVVPR